MSENDKKETGIEERFIYIETNADEDYSQYENQADRSSSTFVNIMRNFGDWLSYVFDYIKDPATAQLKHPKYTPPPKAPVIEDPLLRQVEAMMEAEENIELNKDGLPYGGSIFNATTGETTKIPEKPVKPRPTYNTTPLFNRNSGNNRSNNQSNNYSTNLDAYEQSTVKEFPTNKEFVHAEWKGKTDVIYTTKDGEKYIKHRDSTTDATLAWMNNNPGNLKHFDKGSFAEKHGAIGKDNQNHAIFPSYEAGRKAMIALLKSDNYRNLSLRNALDKYAEGSTNRYLKGVLPHLPGVTENTVLKTLNNKQFENLVNAMIDVEGTKTGKIYLAQINPNKLYLNDPVASDKMIITDTWGERWHPTEKKWALHEGIDIGVPVGTPLYAVADCKIAYAGPSSGYGNVVISDLGHGVFTLYGHLASDVKNLKGKTFKRGKKITESNDTGLRTGEHLHYEIMIRRGDVAYVIDPQKAKGKDLSNRAVQDILINDAKTRAHGKHKTYDPTSAVFASKVPKQGTSKFIASNDEQQKLNDEFNDASDQNVVPNEDLADNTNPKSNREHISENSKSYENTEQSTSTKNEANKDYDVSNDPAHKV